MKYLYHTSELSEIEESFAKNEATDTLEKLAGEIESGIDIYKKHIPYDPSSPY